MKSTLPLALCAAAILASGCAAGISRTGYARPDSQAAANLPRRPIAIQRGAKFDPDDIVVLGSIHAYDTGFSTACDEAKVLETFYKEANSVGADVINITQEKQPDFWSTCYRARAQFIRFKDRAKAANLFSDPRYAPELIIERSVESKKRTREIIAASVFGGVLGGVIVDSVTRPRDSDFKAIPAASQSH